MNKSISSSISKTKKKHKIKKEKDTNIELKIYSDKNIKKKKNDMKLPWVEKYRPQNLDDIVSHKDLVRTLRACVKNKTFTHLLLYGPPGTGKTSIINASVKELYGKNANTMVMELNASDDRGIECVRDKIKGFVSSGNITFNEKYNNLFKLVILDEMDSLTYDAQAILRKVIEDYTINARFCLICNYTKNISHALMSRCPTYRFPPLTFDDIKKNVIKILEKENVKYTNESINTIIKRSMGDMRIVLNNLQVVSMGYGVINNKTISKCLAYPKTNILNNILLSILNESFYDSYKYIHTKIIDCGISLQHLINELTDILVEQLYTEKDKRFEPLKNIDNDRFSKIIINLSNIQYYLTGIDDDCIFLGALIGSISHP